MQLLPYDTDVAEDNPYIGFTCNTIAGSDRYQVKNYEGLNSLSQDDNEYVENTTATEQLAIDEVEYGSFRDSGIMTDYSPIESTTSGNTLQECVAIMDIPKFGRDADIFQKWQVYVGARSY
jgi:hypothetical protein